MMKSVQRIPMTRQGYDKLKKDLDQLKSVERPKNIRDIEEARAHGDLSENAEYHAAKERSSHINGMIQELEMRLSRAEIIDPTKFRGERKIVFGAHVTLLDTGSDEEITYQIVGEYESDIQAAKISVTSPIGRALIGQTADNVVKVTTPKGVREFEIVAINYK